MKNEKEISLINRLISSGSSMSLNKQSYLTKVKVAGIVKKLREIMGLCKFSKCIATVVHQRTFRPFQVQLPCLLPPSLLGGNILARAVLNLLLMVLPAVFWGFSMVVG